MLKHVSITYKALLAPLFSSCMIVILVGVFHTNYRTTEEKSQNVATVQALDASVRAFSTQAESAQALLGRFSSWVQTGTEVDESLGGVPGLVSRIALLDQSLSAIESRVENTVAGLEPDVQATAEELVMLIRNRFAEFSKTFLTTAEVIDSNPYISTNVLVSSYPSYDELSQSIVKLEHLFTAHVQVLESTATTAKYQALINVIAMSVFALVASLLTGWWFGQVMAVPVRKLSYVIACMANRNYEVPVSGTTNRDEIGAMALAVDRFKEQLREKERLELQSQFAANNTRIRHALARANTNLIVTDERGNALFVNHAMSAMLQQVAEQLPQIPFVDGLLDPEKLNLLMLLDDKAETDLFALSETTQSERQLGELYLQQIISPVFDESNKQNGLVFEWINTTQQKAREALIQQANERESEQAELLRTGADNLLSVVGAALKGDLTQRISIEGSDAMCQVGSALDRFFISLADDMREISFNADKLSEFSADFENLSIQMHVQAKESTLQIEDVSGASDEISSNISSVSVAVSQMDSSIREIAKNSEQASAVAGDAVTIAQSADKLMRQLHESSSSIGAMVKVINSIAEQTNLLALNATIESARAGDAGKGFAVVANEVKELAKETANATDEISRRINTIQQDSDGAVSAITDISQIIHNISQLQEEITTGIREQTLATQGIRHSAVQTDTRATGIIQNIAVVSAGSEHTLLGMARAQESATKLKNMAASMHALVAQFTISERDG